MSWPPLTPLEWSALLLSLKVAGGCVLVSVVPGVALGWLLARRRFPGKAVVDALVHAPLVIPPVVTGVLLLAVFGRRAPLGAWLEQTFGLSLAFTWQGAVLASAVMGFPLLVRAVRLAMELVDRRLEEAARTLGAGRWRTFFSITLPLALPGFLTGCVLAFARSLGEFGATITFAGSVAGETQTIPLAVYGTLQTPGAEAATLRLSLLSILLALAALLVSEFLARRMRRRLGRRSGAEEGLP
ncbi:MAG TPA: molybdate ABC transporter permease subunit [Candidatus Sumerlaeota bacterium]|nr:molybdate ABC transporter permease subunit [Candidatus Sumerlaeota bacterium]HOR28554.1 molybdate ABC transporter permease subunit [Candidatus Sumerlaeota bacterium]HPK03337.1 molybdate ABC transporter permease subunit [Candidatus Sumerlaeota bacterium]